MKAKAEARRSRLRAKIEQRTQGVQIEAPETKERDVAVMKIGAVRIATTKRPGKTRRGVDVKRRHV